MRMAWTFKVRTRGRVSLTHLLMNYLFVAIEEENQLLRAKVQQLLAEHKRDEARAARPSATAGAGSSNTPAGAMDLPGRSLNADSGPSNARQPPHHTAASGVRAPLDIENEDNIRIPPPTRKENLTIEEIRRYLGLTDSRQDHLTWLEWRVREPDKVPLSY